MKQCATGQATDGNMAPALCMMDNNDYKLYSEYVIPIDFALQQCLQERAALLRCTYIACIVVYLCCICVRAGFVTVSCAVRRGR